MNEFLTEENMQTVWEVVSDKEAGLYSTEKEYILLHKKFLHSMNDFFEREKRGSRFSQLIDMNKYFIGLFFKEMQLQNKKDGQGKLIKSNEFKAERLNQFERRLREQQNDLSNIINVAVPETPNFSEEKDAPMEGMEDLIARMVQERQYDMEQVKPITNKEELQQFLNLQETSINTQKNKNVTKPVTYNVENVKFIHIGEENDIPIEAVSLTSEEYVSKDTTKDTTKVNFAVESHSTDSKSILSKLKMINAKDMNKEKHPKALDSTNDILEQIISLRAENAFVTSLLERIVEKMDIL
jgi:hypothetical protein